MIDKNSKSSLLFIKKILAVSLVIFLVLNLFAIASGFINNLIFWINLGILAIISYYFLKDTN